MKKTLLLSVLLLIYICMPLIAQKLNFTDGTTYDPFFTVRVLDSEGTEYTISRCSFIPIDEENPESISQKYFFWIRRGTRQGLAMYTLDFNRISRIEFNGEADRLIEGFTPATLYLVNEKSYEVYVATEGFIDGIDEEFGSYVRLLINYNLLKSITFLHQGTYKRCPFCGTLFYDTQRTTCPFDKNELIPQSVRE